MKQKTFQAFAKLIYDLAGISLNDGKAALVTARVGKRMRALGIVRHEEYLQLVVNDATGDEVTLLLDAISTNVTSFYREPAHFEVLTRELRARRAGGVNRYRLWSAACSTGEEPLTMAMTALEACGAEVDLRILGTDISTRALSRARAARYPAERLAGVSAELRQRYFQAERAAGRTEYTAGPALRGVISLARLNLADPPFPMSGPFDAIFCRNVMIYFDQAVRQRLVAEMTRLLRPGGLLLIGHAESLTGLQTDLRSEQPAVYRKP